MCIHHFHYKLTTNYDERETYNLPKELNFNFGGLVAKLLPAGPSVCTVSMIQKRKQALISDDKYHMQRK